jgi:2'-5' RNA ligase
MVDDKPMRLFIGAAISAACAEELRATSEALAGRAGDAGLKMRWVAPANYHVTAKFLGWVKPGAVYAIRDVVALAIEGLERFELRAVGLGAFPDLSKARVLWAGIEDQSQLEALATAIDAAVAPLGFAPEKRAYHAHVTLARLKKVADVSGLVGESERAYSTSRCQTLNLYESVTKSTGSEYHVRWQWPLAGGKRQSVTLKGGS